ncbi:hypothetical protein IWW39_001469 [Coemansia spiralis]|uniref:N-acetyltransferase domain-containing protein n=2 Tax=Coemansia TaxID=4863 RepID=A0A9W8GMP8_9FUNG|nr:hypothetical protein IWW39_001469 [Coemansia spiralis]
MATKFKYNLESLEWDSDHRRNKEAAYCYCGLDYNDGDCMLRCSGCQQLFHWDCVGCLKSKPLYGDSFYRFSCSVCNGGGSEEYKRDTLSWVQVIYVVLYHLIKTEPEKPYFRWRENICATINDNWEGLMPGKAKTATWHNTVAGCLSTHNSMFRSGFDDTQQPGNWTLKEVVEPALAHFKAPTKSRDASSSSKPARRDKAADAKKLKRKSVSRPAIVEAGSEAEKEILEALGEAQIGSKRSARHRVSFSDDEDSDDSHSRRRGAKAKRRRPDPRILDDDADLLSSLQLYQSLEKQNLGKAAATEEPSSAKLAAKQIDDEEEVVEVSGTVVSSPAMAKTKTSDLHSAIDQFDSCSSSLSSWDTDSEHDDLLSLDEGSGPEQDIVMSPSPVASPALVPTRVRSPTPEVVPVPVPDSVPSPTKSPVVTEKNDVAESRIAADDSGSRLTADDAETRLAAKDMEPRLVAEVVEPRFVVEEVEATDGTGWTLLDGVVPQAMFDPSELTGAAKPLAIMSERAQWELRAKLGSSRAELTYTARRLHRRLELRKHKRMLGLPIFNMDEAVKKYMSRPQVQWDIDPRMLDTMRTGGGSLPYSSKDESTAVPGNGTDQVAPEAMETEPAVVIKTTPYANSFASRLMGRAVLRDSLTTPVSWIGPFNGRLLRPYIWRDWKSTEIETGDQGTIAPGPELEMTEPGCELSKEALAVVRKRPGLPMLQVHRAIRLRNHAIFNKLGLESGEPSWRDERDSIDYVFFQSEHVKQVNELLRRTFWPGIDMSDALQAPEFSIVALYRRNVVGCAFLTPDAYLTYIAVSAGWEGAGIARYMVYHLAQTVPTKDVTLHVSASNLAMLFYQRLGFKPEKFAVNFYKHYLPASSRQSPNAFFMRLRRY